MSMFTELFYKIVEKESIQFDIEEILMRYGISQTMEEEIFQDMVKDILKAIKRRYSED